MQRTLLKSKIHRATVIDAALHYEGSITIDEDLLDAADIVVHEQVDVYDVTNAAAPHHVRHCRAAGFRRDLH